MAVALGVGAGVGAIFNAPLGGAAVPGAIIAVGVAALLTSRSPVALYRAQRRDRRMNADIAAGCFILHLSRHSESEGCP